MPITAPADTRFLTALSELAYCNPFHPERIALERNALGGDFEPEENVAWSRVAATAHTERPNVAKLTARAEQVAERMRQALVTGSEPEASEVRPYEDVVSYVLYYRWMTTLSPAGFAGHRGAVGNVWRKFQSDYEYFFSSLPGASLECKSPEHLFACLHQVRRAFRYIFDCILGDSAPAARLRGMVWQSIFTHDMRRYRRTLFNRMADLSTLVTGPSGTGKELVARAIGLSQYVSFDGQQAAFDEKLDEGFLPLNLSALSANLLESELFGHCRGAYTGAAADRVGWLEACPASGAVFLDEIGELDPAIQVKLLRVVQGRVFSRLGETVERSFAGKLIAATNRDLASEMREGRFREDLFYRLCSDRIETPSLREQLNDRPEALAGLVKLIADRLAGEESSVLAEEVLAWVSSSLKEDYPWPGNIRELEQCVRNILVRREYRPRTGAHDSAMPEWLRGAIDGSLSAEQLVSGYCTALYARLGSYEQTAKVVGLDRRTVKCKVDPELLAHLSQESDTDQS